MKTFQAIWTTSMVIIDEALIKADRLCMVKVVIEPGDNLILKRHSRLRSLPLVYAREVFDKIRGGGGASTMGITSFALCVWTKL
jgi:hypothetical protein